MFSRGRLHHQDQQRELGAVMDVFGWCNEHTNRLAAVCILRLARAETGGDGSTSSKERLHQQGFECSVPEEPYGT